MISNKNCINIIGNGQTFPYLIEYINSRRNEYDNSFYGSDVNWHICTKNTDCVHLFHDNIKYYRHNNDWYNYDKDLNETSSQYIPLNVVSSKIRVHLPNHSISTYKRGVKYIVTAHTYINGQKLDLGSVMFKPTDAIANTNGNLKYGNNEYSEYVEFSILDPYYIMYSDEWIDFRHNVCGEPKNINNNGSLLCISLYSVEDFGGRYMIDLDYTGGITSFNISEEKDFLTLSLSYSNGADLRLYLTYNNEYNWLLQYLSETYGIETKLGQTLNGVKDGIFFDIVIKNKDTVIAISDSFRYTGNDASDGETGNCTQIISYNQLITAASNKSISDFFSTWENLSDCWSFVASLVVYDKNEEIFNVVSNELPITQEIFSRFINGKSEKIIDLDEMEIKNYNVVNKVINEVVQVERPIDSKSNIMQPVFFRVKDTELLTLHPDVTENICINLDDYKLKVDRFILQIDNCTFDQIGVNNYGVLFKVIGNRISKEANSGIYYILNENSELVTTGKYNCIR